MRIVLVIALALPSLVLAQDYYGAIAYSNSTGAHGWAKDHPSRAAAEKAALSGCSKHADDCAPVLWFKNACGALALGPKASGWGWGESQQLADSAAINACARHSKACTVKQRVCTTR